MHIFSVGNPTVHLLLMSELKIAKLFSKDFQHMQTGLLNHILFLHPTIKG